MGVTTTLRAWYQNETEQEVESYLRRRFETLIQGIEVLDKEDLSLVRRAKGSARVLRLHPPCHDALTRLCTHRTTTCPAKSANT